MSQNHYQTLRVAPWAEDAVIRAAYVALMRMYHPDKNKDPEAEARVRDITAAFSVLSNPQRRAAYDATGALRRETGIGEGSEFVRRPPTPPLRNLGIASIALAVVVTVTFAVWPREEPAQAPPLLHSEVAKRESPNVPPERAPLPPPVQTAVPAIPPDAEASHQAESQPVLPQVPEREAVRTQPKVRMPVVPRREIATAVIQKPVAPVQIASSQPPTTAPSPRVAPHCPGGRCRNDRRDQIEQIATGFLKQSLDHADSQKQQLLLIAGNRSAASRASCHSDDCVAGAYLREIRETSAIMEGRNPSQ